MSGVRVKTDGFDELVNKLQRQAQRGDDTLDRFFKEQYGPYVRDEVKGQLPSGRLRTGVRVQKYRGNWVVGPSRKLVHLGTWFESGTQRHELGSRVEKRGKTPHMLIDRWHWVSGTIQHPGTRAHSTMERTVDASHATGLRMLEDFVDEDIARKLGFR